MFELTVPTALRLEKASTRIEHHGDAQVTAIDLKVTLTANNKILDMFHVKLRTRLFGVLAAEASQAPGQANLDLPVSDLPNITFPEIEYPIKWDREFSGYTTRIDRGLGGASNMVLNLCVLKSFKFTPIEGGSVEIEFTISSAADITEQMIGRLSVMQQNSLTLSLTAPALVEGGVIDASKDGDAPGTAKAKAKTKGKSATDEFVAQHVPL